MYKVFRKHVATTLQDAFITSMVSKYDGAIIYHWSGNESKAALFDSVIEAKKCLDKLTENDSNNYSYNYSIGVVI